MILLGKIGKYFGNDYLQIWENHMQIEEKLGKFRRSTPIGNEYKENTQIGSNDREKKNTHKNIL